MVGQISEIKNEPEWMYQFRIKALEQYLKMPMPGWGPDLSGLDLEDLFYYVRPMDKQEKNWDDVPSDIKNTFDKLGIPEAEQKFLAGVGAQYESEMVYHSIQKQLEQQGVIFLSIEEGLRQHPELFREYFSKAVPLAITNLPHSILRYGRVDHSYMSPRACMWICRCKPIFD